MRIYIPSNKYRIKEGYYSLVGIISLLRQHKNSPEKIQFLADMLE